MEQRKLAEFTKTNDIDGANDANGANDATELYAHIDNYIDTFCKYLSKSSKWNQARFDASQRSIIRDMLFQLSNGKHIIAEMPTGTGKSIVAMFIAAYFDDKSYILTSDKLLQQQYEDFVNNVLKQNSADLDLCTKHFAKFQVLRGRDNYICNQNNLAFSQGTCQENGLSIRQATVTMPCSKTCEYIVNRQLAIDSQCAILNYSYWLTLMNRTPANKFGTRAVTIMDECHKIDDVLTTFMDISIGPKFIQDCSKAESMIVGMINQAELDDYISYKEQLFAIIKSIIAEVSVGASIDAQRTIVTQLITNAYNLLDSLQKPIECLANKIENNTPLSVFDKALKRFIGKLQELCVSLDDIMSATAPQPSSLIIVLEQSTNSIVFKCTNDELLCKQLVHRHCNLQVFMSATIGDIESWAKLNGVTNYVGYSIESDWQFKCSPIHICMPLISLSYANIYANLPRLVETIDNILELHESDNGVIHCATKRIANYICANSKYKSRTITYTNSTEKSNIVSNILVPGNNKVLVAYSATEGVSLDDDKCRFQIIAKLSWQNLGDIVIKTKADNNGNWYILKTLQSLIQAIGRGIRHSEDYCTTYILDSSFSRIQKSCKFSTAISKRLVYNDFEATKAQKSLEEDEFFKQFI